MKKPEPVVKADETGSPKTAVAGAVGVGVAVAWRLFSRMRNAGGGGRNNAWKTVTADAKEKLAAAGLAKAEDPSEPDAEAARKAAKLQAMREKLAAAGLAPPD